MNKKTVIILAVIIVILLAILIFATGSKSNVPQTQAPAGQTLNNQPPASLYTSNTDGFSANFSGTPQVTNTTFNSPSAGPIPLTEYKFASGTGSSTTYDIVYVYHYPQSYQFSSDYLTNAMKTFATAIAMKYPGSKLTTESTTQFQGASAVNATITTPVDGTQENDYLMMTVRGQNLYAIGTYGKSQNDYNAFINSFAFSQ